MFINGKFIEGVGAQRLEVHSPSTGGAGRHRARRDGDGG